MTLLVSLLGLGAEFGDYVFGLPAQSTQLFSLSYEGNVPTWYSSALLLTAGLLLTHISDRCSRRGGDYPRLWRLLAALFIYMSLDEAIEIHEYLVYLVPFETGGALYFAWVIPASVIVLGLGLLYLPFLRHLPDASRRRFITAAVLFVGGALLMELPLGWWADRAGDDNLVYGLLDWAEETLELSGVTVFIIALARHDQDDAARPATSET